MVRSRFASSLSRLRIIGAALLLAALAVGCSTVRFGYSQGPELAYWWFDRYLDFPEEQSPAVRDALADWFAWHRRTQLPDYAVQLERMRGELRADATPQQMCRWYGELRQRSDLAIEQALPMLAEMLRAMTPAQLAYLNRQYAKRNREFREEFLQDDGQERMEASIKRAVERFENLYGRLDAPQRDAIAKAVQASPFDAERWAQERESRQRDVVQTAMRLHAERASPAQAVAQVRGLAQRWQRSPDPAYRAYADRLTQYNCAFAATVHNATTAAQREAAARRMRGWAEDARSLAASAPPPAPARATAAP
jgi:hypothetical protein